MRFLAPRDTQSPFAPFDWLRTEMDRLFEHATPYESDGWTPPLSLSETEGAYEVTLPLPGAEPEKVEVGVEGGVLRVSGEREGVPAGAERRYAVERFTGRFARALRLPAEIDTTAVEAHFHEGVLRITLPKAEEARPRRIPVQV